MSTGIYALLRPRLPRVNDMLIDRDINLNLRRKIFFLAIFNCLLLSLLLSFDIYAADRFGALKKSAEQGDAESQFNLGTMFFFGDGVPKNDVAAFNWFMEAAEQGHARAQHHLGAMYDIGMGVPENDVAAVTWYLKAAEQGLAEAQFSLGEMYAYGEGVPEDDVVAVTWYLKAAEQGYVEAQFSLGLMFYNGEGVPQDDVQAYAWISVADAQDNSDYFNDFQEAKKIVAESMTRDEITRAQVLSVELWKSFGKPRKTN